MKSYSISIYSLGNANGISTVFFYISIWLKLKRLMRANVSFIVPTLENDKYLSVVKRIDKL